MADCSIVDSVYRNRERHRSGEPCATFNAKCGTRIHEPPFTVHTWPIDEVVDVRCSFDSDVSARSIGTLYRSIGKWKSRSPHAEVPLGHIRLRGASESRCPCHVVCSADECYSPVRRGRSILLQTLIRRVQNARGIEIGTFVGFGGSDHATYNSDWKIDSFRSTVLFMFSSYKSEWNWILVTINKTLRYTIDVQLHQ